MLGSGAAQMSGTVVVKLSSSWTEPTPPHPHPFATEKRSTTVQSKMRKNNCWKGRGKNSGHKVEALHSLYKRYWCILQAVLIFSFVRYERAKYGEYVYPMWADFTGWIFVFAAILPIFIIAALRFLHADGPTFLEVCFVECNVPYVKLFCRIGRLSCFSPNDLANVWRAKICKSCPLQKWHNATKPKLEHPAISTIEVNDYEKKIYMQGDDHPDHIGIDIVTLFLHLIWHPVQQHHTFPQSGNKG